MKVQTYVLCESTDICVCVKVQTEDVCVKVQTDVYDDASVCFDIK